MCNMLFGRFRCSKELVPKLVIKPRIKMMGVIDDGFDRVHTVDFLNAIYDLRGPIGDFDEEHAEEHGC